MPAELALLPIVESAFDPFAYSHGRAAGLVADHPRHRQAARPRRRTGGSTAAATCSTPRAPRSTISSSCTQQFDGDWLLAVAGYNSGEGNVARALKKAAAAGKPQDFWGIKSYLPAETRTYVPRLLAIAELVGNPGAFGVTLPELRNEPRFAVVETGGQIDMALAAELAGMPTDALYALNPGVNRWATDPEGPHRLLLPIDASRRVRGGARGARRARARAVDAAPRQQRRDDRRHRRPLSNDGRRAARGQRAARQHDPRRRLPDDSARDAVARELHAERRCARRAAAEHARAAASGASTSCKAGESLWSISRAYDVDVRSLASWNAMAPGDVLSVGRELVVWTEAPPTRTVAVLRRNRRRQASLVRSDSVTSFAATNRIREITYVVRRGDSLSSIARRFKVTVDKLVEWNTGAADKYLQPGQRLKMVVDVTEQSG